MSTNASKILNKSVIFVDNQKIQKESLRHKIFKKSSKRTSSMKIEDAEIVNCFVWTKP